MKKVDLTNILYKYHIKQAKKYKDKILDKRQADWYEFEISNGQKLYCGIDNNECSHKACISAKHFEKYGCMYIKGFKDY